jgi:Flp pilus assembly protein TadG
LVIVALAVFLLGAVGLAIDGSHLYAERQMAQAAADAAAQAGIRSVFTGSYSNGSSQAFSGSTFPFTCATSDARTPCYYAQTLNGFNTSNDTVIVSQPSPASLGLVACGTAGSPLFCGGGVNLLQVTVSRRVPTPLFSFIGSWIPTVSASATGAIVSVVSPVPIVVTHPTMSGSLQSNGGNTVQICGGAGQSIQVNSVNATAVLMDNNTTINLSKAGPADPGTCTTGTGAGFGVWGGPLSPTWIFPSNPTVWYQSPNPPINDPLAGVAPPSVPSSVTPTMGTLPPGTNGCPATLPNPLTTCTLYSPGYYNTSDIVVKGQVAVFEPGIYYMYNSNFLIQSDGDAYMSTGLADPKTGTSWVSNMLVYMTGPTSGGVVSTGYMSIKSNGTATLTGSPSGSAYDGILFFQDRLSAAHNTFTHTNPHATSGKGQITLVGTLYFNNTTATATQYQELNLQGASGSNTTVTGEIIVNALNLGGGATLRMNLNPSAVTSVRQIALVQ